MLLIAVSAPLPVLPEFPLTAVLSAQRLPLCFSPRVHMVPGPSVLLLPAPACPLPVTIILPRLTATAFTLPVPVFLPPAGPVAGLRVPVCIPLPVPVRFPQLPTLIIMSPIFLALGGP